MVERFKHGAGLSARIGVALLAVSIAMATAIAVPVSDATAQTVPSNVQQAELDRAPPFMVKRYRDAAEAGDARAQFRLAYLHENGLVTGARDLDAAARWYAASAEGGYPPAQFKIGVFLQTGRGVAADPPRAAEFYRMAASAGVAEAAFNLASMLAEGDGIERDAAAAVEYYEQAALSGGMVGAMMALGDLYSSDIAGSPDPVEAWAWYTLAMEEGAEVNAERMAAIEGSLDDAGLAEARRLVEAYKNLRTSKNSN